MGDVFYYNGVKYIVVGFENRGRRVIGVNPEPKTGEPIKVNPLKSKVKLNP
jgi:hypothetical protein